jgi:hypothetical protein
MDEAERKSWRRARMLYYLGLCALFVLIAGYLGPNWILFHKLTWLSPADFANEVREEGNPVVAALARYRKDHGELPEKLDALVPDYLPARHDEVILYPDGKVAIWSQYNHFVQFDFARPQDGWQVNGAFTSGRIPVDPVDIRPTLSSRPAH